jgi:hypothetical protein
MKETTRIARLIRAVAKTEKRDDATEMRKLAKLVESGKGKAAYKAFRGLDTYVREGIPDEAMVFINTERAGGKKKSIVVRVKAKRAKKEFKKGLGVGVLFQCSLEFPADATDEEMAMAVVNQEKDILDRVVEVEYSEPVKIG